MATEELPLTDDDRLLRYCIRPGCGRSFNIADVFMGKAAATGWRQPHFFGGSYLCPDDTAPCASGEHLPRWLNRAAGLGMTGIGCDCGWAWEPAAPSTMGDHRDQWAAHLAEVIEAAAAAETES